MLSNKQILKFQILYKKHFNKKITREESHDQGAKLVRLVALVYKPITDNGHRVTQRSRKEKHDR